jgi:ABC-type glycerol-3-phosphate transport system substrate-binding protein
MKKRILSFVLLLVMVVTLSACGGSTLSGTFSDATGTVSYTFNDGKASMSMAGMPAMDLGEFEVKDGDLYIAGTKIGTVSRNTITIEGLELTKR